MSKALFLDRDGVILATEKAGRPHFTNKPKDIMYLPYTAQALQTAQEKGYSLIIVSNQGGVGMGKMSIEMLDAVNESIETFLQAEGVALQGIYCCTHTPWAECSCRKPKPGMLLTAMEEHNIDATKSYMIGDMSTDISAGKSAGLKTILVQTGFGGADGKVDVTSDHIVADLYEAVHTIL